MNGWFRRTDGRFEDLMKRIDSVTRRHPRYFGVETPISTSAYMRAIELNVKVTQPDLEMKLDAVCLLNPRSNFRINIHAIIDAFEREWDQRVALFLGRKESQYIFVSASRTLQDLSTCRRHPCRGSYLPAMERRYGHCLDSTREEATSLLHRTAKM